MDILKIRYLMKILILGLIIFLYQFGSLQAKEMVTLHLKNGVKISGELISTFQKDSVKIMLEPSFIVTYAKSQIKEIEFEKYNKIQYLGCGIGTYYGGMGLNYEILFNEYNISTFVGAGTYFFEAFGFSVGCKQYLVNSESSFLPHIDFLVGTNTFLEITNFYNDTRTTEACYGINIGAGFKWMFGEYKTWGIDFNVYYVLTSTIFDRIEKLSKQYYDFHTEEFRKVNFSMGINWK